MKLDLEIEPAAVIWQYLLVTIQAVVGGLLSQLAKNFGPGTKIQVFENSLLVLLFVTFFSFDGNEGSQLLITGATRRSRNNHRH